ncbi:MAG: hypothetical protein GY950_15340 [bacterium]|nr:hypothetical protein [bacterium]
MDKKLKNKFNLFEWSGAFGDIGLLLPLAFAFCIFNGFSPGKLFFLFGLAYLVTGFYYKVPVAVQPLKAIAVIAIVGGYQPDQLASTAFFYGIIFIFISAAGVLRFLQPLFTPAIVRGIQVGIGLILIHKAIALTLEKGLFLGWERTDTLLSVIILVLTVLVLWFFQFRKQVPVSIFLIIGSILLSFLLGVTVRTDTFTNGPLLAVTVPDFGFLVNSLIFLIIPQLPLTIGNAVYAASDICRHLWKERARRVSPTKLGFSIGILNVFIGLFGGFPVCHGSGGMAAHHQFGGKTGGTTMIIGAILVLVAVVSPVSHFIFYIPIPVMGALLFITGLKMAYLAKSFARKKELIVIIAMAAIAFFTRNLLIAVLAGMVLERLLKLMAGWKWFAKPGKTPRRGDPLTPRREDPLS